MGRLFWKFFFFFWLAQLVTAVGVGVAIWLLRTEHVPSRPEAALSSPPAASPGLNQAPPSPPARTDSPALRPESMPRHKRALRVPLMPLIAGSVVSLLFAAFLAWYFARPIRNLRTAFEAVAGGRLETRVGATMGQRKDELAELGVDFDRMAERLQNLLEGQRRLLHDVSHELRSPLARMQAAADLLRQQPERSGEFLERIERDTVRIDRLVGELLTLARLDSGMLGKLAVEVDLNEIIGNIADDAQFEAEPRHCRVQTSLTGPLLVAGNHDLLYRAIENIVRNAVKHSPDGGTINISARPEAGRQEVLIEIADQGPGVPASDLDSIFEPFFRSSAADGNSGYGLGLAITRRVVMAHGGTVCAANQPGAGLAVTVRLPALH